VFSGGGILYLVFQDIAPQAKLARHWAPPLGAVVGFLLGMVAQMVVETGEPDGPAVARPQRAPAVDSSSANWLGPPDGAIFEFGHTSFTSPSNDSRQVRNHPIGFSA
jgi:hypothetical protein